MGEEGFHHGVIGIVASKILDRYYKPTIIMEIKPDEGIATASCRSIEGFNIIEAINNFSDLLIKYGGHSGAAGFSIKIENIEEFSRKLNEYAENAMEDSTLIKPVKVDRPLPFYKISYDFLDKISLLEPFGFGNPSPLFSLDNCQFDGLRLIGKDKKHLMMNIIKNGNEIRNCVWFNSDDVFEDLVNLRNIDIAFKLKLETYKDRYQYKMYVEDIRETIHTSNEVENIFDLYDIQFPIETVIYTRRKMESPKIRLTFSDQGITVANDRTYLGTLDSQTEFILSSLKEMYNVEFSAAVKDVIMKDENYNVHILIDKDYTFSSYAIKQSELFKDIKNFLIKDFNYNCIQKKTLASVFKDKNNTITIMERGRGVETIIQTIGLYYKNINEKALLVTKENISKKTISSIGIGDKFVEGYDFYIFLNPEKSEIEKYKDKKILIITEDKSFNIDGFSNIVDDYDISQNIRFVSEEELKDKNIIFSKKLPLDKKIQVIKNLKTYLEVYSTKDILPYL